jgi:Fe(3+) dicitrate transport protein
MKFKPRKISIVVASVMQATVFSAGAENNTVVTLDPVAINAILPDRLEVVPGSFAVVNEKDLRESVPFTVKEALTRIPGVHSVGEDAFGLGLNIGIRGMDPRRTSRTLLLEDGVPLFLAPYADPSAHYSTPLDRVERIEVVKGSGQVLYGPQTVGGMINFTTRPLPVDGFAGSVSATRGNNSFLGSYANVGYGGALGGLMLDVLQKKGDGVRENHDFDVREYTLKGLLRLSERQTLIAKLSKYEEDSHISETGLGALEYAQDKYQAPTGKQDRFIHERSAFHMQHVLQLSDQARLSTQIYRVRSERASFRQINDPGGFDDNDDSTGFSVIDRCGTPATEVNSAACGGRWRPREYEYWGVEPRLDFSHKLFGIDSDAVLGVRYHAEDIDRNQYRAADPRAQHQGWAEIFGTHREDIRINTKARSYYAQNTFQLGDWAVTPGVRIEDYKLRTDIVRADGDPQNNPESKATNRQTVVLPGFGVAWNGIANTTVFAGVHKGFAPPRPDRDINEGNGEDTAVVDKTKAEESTNWEIGVRSQYFKGIRLESTLFHTDFDNIVVKTGGGTFINGGRSEMSGIELVGRIDFGKIFGTADNFYAMGSYTNLFVARFDKNGLDPRDGIVRGQRLPYAPRHLVSFSLGYQHPVGVDARIGVDHVSRQQPDTFARVLQPVDAALSGLSGDIPAYTLLNASITYKPQGTKATLFLSAHNLTDKEYLVSRVDGMVAGRKRQVFGGMRYDF